MMELGLTCFIFDEQQDKFGFVINHSKTQDSVLLLFISI